MKNKKINLYNYVLNPRDDTSGRSMLYGVYHERGFKIATDAHVMCVVKSDYPKELERKIVDRSGYIIDRPFVRGWRKYIPKTTRKNLLNLDLQELRIRTLEGFKRIVSKKEDILVVIKGPDKPAYYDGRELLKFLDFLTCYPDCKIYYTSFDRALKASNRNGEICLLMPRNGAAYRNDTIVMYPKDYKETEPVCETPSEPEISEEEENETSYAIIKTDGLKPGTQVEIPAEDPDMPFKGTVVKCYENGPVPQDQYAVIVKLDDNIMEIGQVKKIYPSGLMFCLDSELKIIHEPDFPEDIPEIHHFVERCFSRGWTYTGNMECNTGQMLYLFEPLSRQTEMSIVVREDGVSSLFYQNNRMTKLEKNVDIWMINGYEIEN